MAKNNPKKGSKFDIDREDVERLLEKVRGKMHFVILIRNKPALKISLHDKTILVEIQNPILALTLGIEHLAKGSESKDIGFLKRLKKAGYKVKIKYNVLEFEL